MTTGAEMERLARAAAEHNGLDWDAMPERCRLITDNPRSTRRWWRDTTSAVLTALLPPSEAMIDGGMDAAETALREMDPERFSGEETWRVIGAEKPDELAQIRTMIAAVQSAAIQSILQPKVPGK